MVPSVSEEYSWRLWVQVCLISQTTSSNFTTHFCNFHPGSVEYRICCLTIVRKNVLLLSDHLRDSCLLCSVALCNVGRFGSNYLHKLARGPPSYILRTGSGQTDGRDVYGISRRAPMIMSLVTRRNYGVLCHCSTVPMLVWEAGVALSFWTQTPKVGYL